MKKCTKCKIFKYLEDFHKSKRNLDGRYSSCKLCRKQQMLSPAYKSSKKLKDQIRYEENKCKIKNRTSKYYKNNKYCIYNKMKNRYNADVNYRLKCLLRTRLNRALKQNYKSGSAVTDLGCSIEFFKHYLESKFQEGMSWDNHGKWHIDHINPLSSFDLKNRDELLKACHYTNLQPLWAEDNIRKSDKKEV